MGLDAVVIILRTEDLFGITIQDQEAGVTRTVGDFYQLICSKLDVPPLSSPVTSAELPHITDKKAGFLFFSKHTSLPIPPQLLPWSPQLVWDALVVVFVDQQGLRVDEIRYHARIAQDLGVD